MRSKLSKRAALLVVLALAAPWLGGTVTANAEHGADGPSWVAQAGNGNGESKPVIPGVNVRTVLFHPDRFPVELGFTDPEKRPVTPRYLAYGTVPVSSPLSLVLAQVVVLASDNGLRWSTPKNVFIKDPAGIDVPLLINDSEDQLDVVYGEVPIIVAPIGGFTNVPFHFALYYSALDQPEDETSSIHVATSVDSQVFAFDTSLFDLDEDEPVVGGTGFKQFSMGPTDVVFQPDESDEDDCGVVDPDGAGPRTASPWNCRLVMLYESNDGDAEHVSIASSGNGLDWRGHPAPLVSPGAAGAWDDESATLGHVRVQDLSIAGTVVRRYTVYYSGGMDTDLVGETEDSACFGGLAPCWSLGSAVSEAVISDGAPDPGLGLVYAKNPFNPVTPRELLERFSPNDPSTLWNAAVVDNGESEHTRIYFTRITNGDTAPTPDVLPQKDAWLAFSDPGPETPLAPATSGATLRWSVPQSGIFPFPGVGDRELTLYITDTLGTAGNARANLTTLSVLLDGLPVTGLRLEDSIVTGMKEISHKVTVDHAVVNTLLPGTHTFTASVADFDGNVNAASAIVTIDAADLVTNIASAPTSRDQPALLWGIGTFEGTTTEGSGITGTPPGIELLRIIVRVTNPLGMTKEYFVPEGQIDKIGAGLDLKKKWAFHWVGPSLDLHYALPGTYTISILGEDVSRNVEQPSAANTKTVVNVLG